MNNQIKVEKDKVLGIYQNLNSEQKALLENIFGSEIFKPKDIKERVKTFEDACNILGNDNQAVIDYFALCDATCTADIIAFAKLRIITAALNQGWTPDWTNYNEYKYYPWFCLYTEDEYNDLDDDDKEKCCRVVGRSSSGAYAYGGLVYAYANGASSSSCTYSGSRLAFKTRELALYAGKKFIELWWDFVF